MCKAQPTPCRHLKPHIFIYPWVLLTLPHSDFTKTDQNNNKMQNINIIPS